MGEEGVVTGNTEHAPRWLTLIHHGPLHARWGTKPPSASTSTDD